MHDWKDKATTEQVQFFKLLTYTRQSNYISECLLRLPLADSKDDIEPREFVFLVKHLDSYTISVKDKSKQTEIYFLSKVGHNVLHWFSSSVNKAITPYQRAREHL